MTCHHDRRFRTKSVRDLACSAVPLIASLALIGPARAQLGSVYCQSTPNSTIQVGALDASGSLDVAQNDLTLHGSLLPSHTLGYLLVSRARGITPMPGGSAGTLCLGGPLGRYSSFVVDTGAAGVVTLPVDLTSVPSATGSFAVVRGDSLQFQFWFRDVAIGGGTTSNFTAGLCVTFCPDPPFAGSAITMAAGPTRVRLADLDGDGALDLFGVAESPATLAVRLGRGDGTFEPLVLTSTEISRTFADPVDFDGDGDLDLVGRRSSSSSSGQAVVMFHTSGGAFTAPAVLNVGYAQGFGAGDLDGDGDNDLLETGLVANGLAVLTNDGQGGFTQTGAVDLGSEGGLVVTGDLDQDGDLDAVVQLMPYPPRVRIIENLGGGVLRAGATALTSYLPKGALLDDLDGDGDLDLALWFPETSNTLSVHHNIGGLTFGWETHTSLPLPPVGLAHGDVDGDGDTDFMAVNSGSNQPSHPVVLLRNNGHALFGYSPLFELGGYATSLALGDVDADGRMDLAASGGLAAHLVYGGVAALLDAAVTSIPVSFPTEEAFPSLVAADLDGDPWPDVVWSGRSASSSPHVSVQVVRSSGNWSAPSTSEFAFPLGTLAVAPADFDGDGRVDLAVTSSGGSQLTILRNIGGGQFSAVASSSTGGSVFVLASGDLDGDGDVDLVHTLGSSSQVAVLRNVGNAMFQPAPAVLVGPNLRTLLLADFDGDSDLDLCAAQMNGPIVLRFNAGDGSFAGLPVSLPSSAASAVESADFDGDGDIAALTFATFTTYVIDVHDKLGGGTFGPKRQHFLPSTARGLASIDVEGDGDSDLVTVTDVLSALVFLRNRGDGVFDAPELFSAGWLPRAFACADFDADGDVDTLTVSMGSTGFVLVPGNCR